MVRRQTVEERPVNNAKAEGLEMCPFCGSESIELDNSIKTAYFICHGCGAVVSFCGAEEKDQAKERWNLRVVR